MRFLLKNLKKCFRKKKDFYKILNIPNNSKKEDIKKSFVNLVKKYHPDLKKGNLEKFKEINEAYSILGDLTKKKKYDDFLKNSSKNPEIHYKRNFYNKNNPNFHNAFFYKENFENFKKKKFYEKNSENFQKKNYYENSENFRKNYYDENFYKENFSNDNYYKRKKYDDFDDGKIGIGYFLTFFPFFFIFFWVTGIFSKNEKKQNYKFTDKNLNGYPYYYDRNGNKIYVINKRGYRSNTNKREF